MTSCFISEGRMIINADDNNSNEIIVYLRDVGFLEAAVIGKIGSNQKKYYLVVTIIPFLGPPQADVGY